MKVIENTIIKPLPSKELIEQKEKYWHQTLPEDYKKFLMNNNGAEPIKAYFACKGLEYGVERFLCVLDKRNLNSENKIYEINVVEGEIFDRLTDNEDLIGVEILPIADLGNDFLCLDFRRNPDAPTVCIWDEEESGELEPVTYEVAKSFTEFCNMLYEG